jgi:hypothetical protein
MAKPEEGEAGRIARLGLVEVAVAGTALTLLGPADKAKPLTLAQREEMARRLNEVGPMLPRYYGKQERWKLGSSTDEREKAMQPKGKEEGKQADATAAAAPSPNAVVPADGGKKAKAASTTTKKGKGKSGPVTVKKFVPSTPEEVDRFTKKAEKERKAKEAEAAKAAKSAPKAPKKKAKKSAASGPKKEGGGIGGLVSKLLIAKKSNEEILAAVKKEYPKARTSAASIAWYRSKLREEGKLPKG